MKNNINKLLVFTSIILILGSLLIALFCVPVLIGDELWNFINIFKMCNGFKIYNDSNVIVTPLFFYIISTILSIIGPTFFTFRISNLLIMLPFFFCIYKIQKKLNINKSISLFFVAMIFWDTFYLFISNGPNYNTLALLLFMIGLYLYLSDKNSNLLQGFIIFLIFFTKQTTGFFYILAVFIFELYKYKISKKFFNNQFKKIITFIILTMLFLFTHYINGNLVSFINYTLGGLLDFSKNNFSFSAKLYNIFIIVLSVAISTFILFIKERLIKLGFKEIFFDNLILLNVFALCASLILYPILNDAHVLMVIPFYFIILSHIFNSLFKDFFEKLQTQTYINIISVFVLLLLFIDTIITLVTPYTHINAKFISDTTSPYFGTHLFDEYINQIETLKKYISYKNEHGTDVIICYNDAALVMIPLKQSHGAYDLIFYGNLGYNGIKKMKQDILSKEHTEFLVNNDDSYDDSQFVIEIQDFIEENLTKIGEISHYDVYTK